MPASFSESTFHELRLPRGTAPGVQSSVNFKCESLSLVATFDRAEFVSAFVGKDSREAKISDLVRQFDVENSLQNLHARFGPLKGTCHLKETQRASSRR